MGTAQDVGTWENGGGGERKKTEWRVGVKRRRRQGEIKEARKYRSREEEGERKEAKKEMNRKQKKVDSEADEMERKQCWRSEKR